MPEQRVILRLPEGKEPACIKMLVREAEVPYQILEDGRLEIVVPSILDHEIVAVEW
jgi:hypothetical protein